MTAVKRVPSRVLVVAVQRLGDVLLTTPLIRSLRLAWPQAHIAALVFDDTATVLAANTNVDEVLTISRRPALSEHVQLLRRLWQSYDLALSTGHGDRPTLYACIAARCRLGVVAPGVKHAWKRRLLSAWAPFDDLDTHTVVMNLRLADLAGIERSHEVTLAWRPEDETRVREIVPQAAFAVLHLQARFVYKAWHTEGWIALGRWLSARGLSVVLTGSDDDTELRAIEQLVPRLPAHTLNVAGRFTLPQVACLLNRARLYIGPDTVITHTAAAVGTPTIALFGPSNPVKWGPWPRGCAVAPSPYSLIGSQRVGNVYLVQGEGTCVPCMQEGCDRHIRSTSACLQGLDVNRVIAAAQALLGDTELQLMREQ